MKKSVRALSLLLALSLLSAAGCSAPEPEPEASSAYTPAETEAAPESEAVPEETRPPLGLPEADFGGAAFRISCYDGGNSVPTIQPEELTGEAVNDAIYNRNTMLQEQYDFVFDAVSHDNDYNGHTREIAAMVSAGDDSFEMIYGHVVGTCNNAIIGNYMNLYDLPHLNFGAVWWPAQSVDEMTIFGRMYTITGSATYSQLAAAKVVFFNKDLAGQYNLDDPYELVRNGEWTIDALIDRTEGIYQDTNGDGKRDPDDLYGYGTHPMQNGFFVSTNTPILSRTEDGGKEISVMTDRTVALVEKLYSWYYESGGVYLKSSVADPGGYADRFATGHTVFSFGHIMHAPAYYRSSEISYGILPQPKYDTAQEKYIAFACPSLFSVPITCQNTEMTGFVFEAMTYYGYFDIIPVYYETTLKGKIADAPDDVEMLEIVNDALTVSFAYCYDNWEGFAHFLSGTVMNFTDTAGNKDVASVFAKRNKIAQKRLEKCLKAFRGD